MLCLASIITSQEDSCQPLLETVEQAPTLARLVLAAWALACFVAVCVVEAVLEERAQQPTDWPLCPHCGQRLQSKGFLPRQITTLLGVVRWRRRVGRCPRGCVLGPQVAPLDQDLGLIPGQRTEMELQRELEHLEAGGWPAEEPLEGSTAELPLLIGADGVRVPFRSEAQTPRGKTVWREFKVAILARLGRCQTRTGREEPRLEHRRVVAVLGPIQALSPRLWLEALRQGLRSAPRVAWLSDGGAGLWGLCDHLDYERFQALGLPLGSGVVESTCKWLIQQRFKGVGMRWSEDGFNHLLHLRLAWINGRFDTLFPLEVSPNP